jgi:hypothetical protein
MSITVLGALAEGAKVSGWWFPPELGELLPRYRKMLVPSTETTMGDLYELRGKTIRVTLASPEHLFRKAARR